MKNFCAILLLIPFLACQPTQEQKLPDEADVQAVMNDWHSAASEADFGRYFGHFSDSGSIFMGTDASERWTVTEFKAYSKPHFDRGYAWNFTPSNRYIYFSENAKTAWFDEELSTPNLGPSRGTGVLVLVNGEWKIAHYSLTVPIPNSIVDDVVDQIEKNSTKNIQSED